MVTQHAFTKTASAEVRESTKKFFDSLGPVAKMEITKLESPLNSIRRILGDNFYNLTEDSSDDVIGMVISDECSFNMDSIKGNINRQHFELMNNDGEFILGLYNKFKSLSSDGKLVSPEIQNSVKFKCGITSVTKGLICKELTISDFAATSEFDNAGNVIGISGIEELTAMQARLQELSETYQRLTQGGGTIDSATGNALAKDINDFNKKIVDKYLSLIETFFNNLKKWGEVDNVTDIFDATFVFNTITSINDQSTVCTDVYTMHDCTYHHFKVLNNKFN